MEQGTDEGGDDGYEWRKYGQKYVKHGKGLRFYHRCVVKGCTASKKVLNLILTVSKLLIVLLDHLGLDNDGFFPLKAYLYRLSEIGTDI